MANFRTAFHTAVAKQFVDNVFYAHDNLYYFIGRVQPWETVTETAEDGSEIVVANDSIEPEDYDVSYRNDMRIRDDIVYMHKISANDISIVCPVHFWQAGARYDQWDDTKVMVEAPFYVVNSEYNVYKCLNNNSSWSYEVNPLTGKYEEVLHAGQSLVEPTGQYNSSNQYGLIDTGDGYLWKYMYNIPYIKRKKFISQNWMPVQKALQENFYSNGSIDQVIVVDGGRGYSSGSNTSATVVGGSPRRVARIKPLVSSDGSINAVQILDGGNYARPESATISVVDVAGLGHGKYSGNKSAILEPVFDGGVLVNVAIKDPGIDYSMEEKTHLSWVGDGSGASLHPIVDSDGSIAGVVVANGGQGYTYLDVNATSYDDKGTGATFKAVVGGNDLSSDQGTVEQTAISGAIYAIALKNMGSGYIDDETTVTITGDGTGATAHAIVEDGKISQIVVDSYGAGYTYAEVKIGRSWTVGGYVDAEAYAILPPLGGHGADAPNELYGRAVSIYTPIRDDEGLLGLSQDFRQFGLISNPKTFTDQKITTTEVSIMLKVLLRKTEGLQVDDEVTIEGVKHRIVSIAGNTVSLIQESATYREITEYSEFRYDDPVKKITTLYEIESILDTPSVNKYSGQLLATANKAPFVIEKARTIGIRTQIIF